MVFSQLLGLFHEKIVTLISFDLLLIASQGEPRISARNTLPFCWLPICPVLFNAK